MIHEQDNVTIAMTRRQASWLAAIGFVAIAAIFIVGYSWGRWSAMRAVAEKATQDSFIDQAHYALLAMYEEPQQKNQQQQDSDGLTVVDESAEQEGAVQTAPVQYRGLIIGFGHYATARDFVSKLAAQGITTLIQEKVSWNGKKKRVWYQVTTERYTDRDALERLVTTIARSSKIKHAKIERCIEQ